MPKDKDGRGEPIVDGGMYYVQDARTLVGNCISWWRPKGEGYTCNLRDAGHYRGSQVREMRESDVPWPLGYVDNNALSHVRGDVQAFRRNDMPQVEYRQALARARLAEREPEDLTDDQVDALEHFVDTAESALRLCDARNTVRVLITEVRRRRGLL